MRFSLRKTDNPIYIINHVHAVLFDSLSVDRLWQPPHMNAMSIETLQQSITTDTESQIETSLSKYIRASPPVRRQSLPIHEFLFHPANGISGNTFHSGANYITVVKGMPESILSRCALTENEREAISLTTRKYSSQGGYILAVAEAVTAQPIRSIQQIKHLRFVGLIIYKSSIGAKQRRLLSTHLAGQNPFYIMTGQHPSSGRYIAKELNIPIANNTVIDCTQLPYFTDSQKRSLLEGAHILCRAKNREVDSILAYIQAHHARTVLISTEEALLHHLS